MEKQILEAHRKIMSCIHHTPVLTNAYLNKLSGADLYFKCENFQKMGAFKMRGAMHKLLSMSESQLSKGVVTHSSGNFAQALALAAKNLNVDAYIVMPENAPNVKKEAVLNYGGKIIECRPTLASREETADKVQHETGAVFCHPYNDMDVIMGNSSCALELLNEVKDLNDIIAPVGGGGLLSGTALTAKTFSAELKIYGGEPSMADDAYKSLQLGKIIPSVNPVTIADGLRTSLGNITFTILSENIDEIILVEEDEIIQAMKLIWERMKIVVEPSAAVSLAAVLKKKSMFTNRKVGVILSGGNVDLTKLPF